ncbi:hypothetical protein RclHR1_01360019 [Rhizophagus clarus]|uniref:Uncharacterized protein n=1 Tax=Rhizophagus clarus TaxID=94130 RepID=A0A2Z6R2V5_9GLOM|nr:hypothetical protein RclHR1_01360019 [Rhizophagus clarus]
MTNMSDSVTFSSDDDEFFTNDFTGSIPDDIVSSDDKNDDFYSYDMRYSALMLDIGLSFPLGGQLFNILKMGLSTRLTKSKKPSKSCHTNCKWHINLSRPIKNNPDSLVFVTTLFNENSGHNLDISACQFKASKAFTKPMLKDIEWMTTHGHLKPLAIKHMLKAKYNRKVYNQDLYKVIYKYQHDNDVHSNDVLWVFEYLEKCRDDPC